MTGARNRRAASRPVGDAESSTREHLLDAAEELFGEHGYAATSLRRLTTAAAANLAAVNYHFGGKEGLAKAVLARRIEPINTERLRRLDALHGRRRTVAAIVRAFVEPPFATDGKAAACGTTTPGGQLCRVFGRIMIEQPPFLREFLAAQFGEVGARFAAELERAAPRLDRTAVWWRLHFMVGALAHTLQNAAMSNHLSAGRCDPDDTERMIEELVAFTTGGLRTAAPKRRARKARSGRAKPARKPAGKAVRS
ncbi:MAG: TetR family transcriptional regulator [Planctomycetes bacterium]|nr:TetR family transcriptional regulator [Planctomycetota bacterium]